MPGIVVHTLLATRALDAWRGEGSAPFDTNDTRLRNAFLSGAMGPDMGVFPGGEPFVSDLAHYVRTGELTRQLVRQAGSDLEAAYAWGWLTHVLADVAVHPLVNRGAGELLHGDRDRATPYADDPVAHVRVEVAADGICYCRHWQREAARTQPVFDETSIDFLARSFAATYGRGATTAASLLAAHRAWAHHGRQAWSLAAVVGNRLQGRAIPPGSRRFYWLVFLPVRLGTSLVARRRPIYGVTHPVLPPDWLLAELETALDAFTPRFLELAGTTLADFPDYNLDLGAVETGAPQYRPTRATLAALDERRARVASGAPPTA
jgi:hypothetical protein